MTHHQIMQYRRQYQHHYLNPCNPDIQVAQQIYCQSLALEPWDKLTPAQLSAFELDFLSRLPMYQAVREYQYPFFLNLNGNDEVTAAYRRYSSTLGRGYHTPISDQERDSFERAFARDIVERSQAHAVYSLTPCAVHAAL